ncbi:DUF6894 family protein [Methylobacterium brachythecii]|uniref:DUF6894 family protein n=1 Tax=Methylobacterium brachythecii TaxID=1176177 RepID=UPI003CCE35A4
MPRFYFDIQNDPHSIDEDGVSLNDRKHIEPLAVRTLFDIARESAEVLSGSPMTISVRDADGKRSFARH